MLALIFISIKGQETGATGTNDSTGRSGTTTGTDEAKAENEKKMEKEMESNKRSIYHHLNH